MHTEISLPNGYLLLGLILNFRGGAVVFRSEIQTIKMLSSTEADIIDAVTSTTTDKFLRSMLW